MQIKRKKTSKGKPLLVFFSNAVNTALLCRDGERKREPIMTKMEKAAKTLIHQCLSIKKTESILILADEPMQEKAQLIRRIAEKHCKETLLLFCPRTSIESGSLSDIVSDLLQKIDAAVLLTSSSLSHTPARRAACKKGVRIASLPNIIDQSFIRLADTDFNKIARLSQKLRDILTIAKEAKITAPNGSNLVLSLAGNQGYADTGLIHSPGEFSNLPSGEACIAPYQNNVSGVLIIDSGMEYLAEEKEKLILSIKDGRVARISGGPAAQRLRRRLAPFGTKSRIIAEFGIGTNHNARLCGNPLEDEKVLGTVHFGIGNNVSFGGQNDVPIHIDGVVYQATVMIDGRYILKDGKLAL